MYQFIFNTTFAQPNCSTPGGYPNVYGDYPDEPNITESEAICVKIYFHIMRSSSGTGGLNPLNLPAMVQLFNSKFVPHNIAIKSVNHDFIDNDAFTGNLDDSSIRAAIFATNVVPSAINVYIMPITASGIVGVANGIPGNAFIINQASTTTQTLNHELGHCFNLYHTNEGGVINCTINDDCKNCGDYICETPPEYDLGAPGNITNCVYTGSNSPAPPPAITNIMFASPDCRINFAPSQGARMRHALNTHPPFANIIGNCFKITGPDKLCDVTQAAYTMGDPPPGATLLWTVNNGQIFGPNNGQSVVVEPNGFLGTIIITCKITLPGLNTNLFSNFNIIVNKMPAISNAIFRYNNQSYPLAIDWLDNGDITNNVCKSIETTVTMNIAHAASTVWTGPPNSFPATWYISNYSNTNPAIKFQLYTTPSVGQWKLTATNTCGTVAFPLVFNSVQCGGPTNCDYFTISPNPSKDGQITIVQKPAPGDCPPIGKSGIDKINVYNEQGILKQSNTYKNKLGNTTLQLPTNSYIQIVEIIVGNHIEKHKVLIQP